LKIKAKMLRATRGDTIRSRSRTGKPARMLKSAWTEEWDDRTHPAPLGMLLQPVLTARAIERIDRGSVKLGSGAERLGNYFVGQIVGAMNETKPAASVVYDMVDKFITAIESVSYQTNA
jgi:NAD(P)H-dependent flavin oxidoreductase YrpB (nitropropane dioxygenase family)